jgi:hypothetical protein
MSFGYAVGDVIAVTQLAWRTVQNARKACGEHDKLTREVSSLHLVLRRVQHEASKLDSIFQRASDDTTKELQTAVQGCGKVLGILDKIVVKYNNLGEEEREGRKLWSKIRFGNGEMRSLSDLRLEILTYTSGITLLLNLISMGSQGRVEQYMDGQGSELRKIRQSLNWITATLSNAGEGSILTTYSGDDKAVWKELRRELISQGYSSDLVSKHKSTIIKYVKELGERGALDEIYAPSESLSSLDISHVPELASPSINSPPDEYGVESSNELLDIVVQDVDNRQHEDTLDREFGNGKEIEKDFSSKTSNAGFQILSGNDSAGDNIRDSRIKPAESSSQKQTADTSFKKEFEKETVSGTCLAERWVENSQVKTWHSVSKG